MQPNQNSANPFLAVVGVGTMAEIIVERAIAGGWPRERTLVIDQTHVAPSSG